MSRRRSTLAPTLFPFLAVLVCTLGTLILLLALVAQQAAENAHQQTLADRAAEDAIRAASAGLPSAERVRRQIEEEGYRMRQLIAHRDHQTEDLERKRDELAHLEDHLRRVRGELNQLRDEVEAATSGERDEDAAATEDLVLLEEQLEAERKAIEELREAQENREPRIVIVPHQGPNGTDRRPVYLECTAEGLRIWPEDALIPADQLTVAAWLQSIDPAANPLDAALRAIRHHALQHYGDAIPPYPLLVVRPDGIDTYAAARQAMADWDDQFGYELIPQETKLAFPKPDPSLQQRVAAAIRDATGVMMARQRMLPRGLVRAKLAELQRGTVGGPGSSATPGPPYADAGPENATTLAGGGRADAPGEPFPAGTGPSIPGRYGEDSAETGSGLRGSSGRPNAPLPSLSAAKLDRMARANGYKHAGSYDAAATTSPAERYPTTSDLERRLRQASATDRYGQLDGRNRPQGTGTPDGTRSPEGTGTPDGTRSPEGTAERFSAGPPAGGPRREVTDRPGRPVDRGDLGPAQDTELAGDLTDGPGRPTRGTGSTDAGGTSGTAAAPTAMASASQGGSSSISGMSAPPPGESRPENDPRRPENEPGQPPASRSAGGASSPPRADLVRRQGSDWALPRHMAGVRGTSVVRTLRAVCGPDRYVLLPPTRGGSTEMFGISDGDPELAVLELATAIRDRVDRWGSALPGGRWQPRLEVLVMPGGEHRWEQLRRRMSGSGVEVHRVETASESTTDGGADR